MPRIVMSLAVALLVASTATFMLASGPQTGTQAVAAASGGPNVFLIPQADGYGMSSCLAEGSECGKIVAQAWCESKGFPRVASYGLASATDITGSTGGRSAPAEPPLVITCDR